MCSARLSLPASQLLGQTGVAAIQRCCPPRQLYVIAARLKFYIVVIYYLKNLKISACQ